MVKGQLTDTKEPIFIQCDLQLALCGACNYVQLSVVNTLHILQAIGNGSFNRLERAYKSLPTCTKFNNNNIAQEYELGCKKHAAQPT